MRAARNADAGPSTRGGKASGGGRGGKAGGGYQYQPPPEEYDDRVPCPYCGRKFAEVAA